jgi:hypothetical protein
VTATAVIGSTRSKDEHDQRSDCQNELNVLAVDLLSGKGGKSELVFHEASFYL